MVSLDSAVIELAVGRERYGLDRSMWACLPPGCTAIIRSLGISARILAGLVFEPLVERVHETYEGVGLSRETIDMALSEIRILSRTAWVHEVVHRYLFERTVCEHHDNEATRFLETELLKELCFLVVEAMRGEARASQAELPETLVARARAIVEGDVFAPWSIRELAQRCGASESTLARAFKRELGCTPGVYCRIRRLEEALSLLESGRFGVTEVAHRVGYGSATAFSEAFTRQFGRSPSACIPK